MTRLATPGPFLRNELLLDPATIHLYSGAESPALKQHAAAFERYLADKSLGGKGRENAEEVLAETRRLLAEKLGGQRENIAFLGNASEAINRIIASIGLRSGDNIVTTDLEFPTGVLSILGWQDRGVHLNLVRSVDGTTEPESIERAIDSRTRLILLSDVSYKTGARINVEQIKRISEAHGIPFVLDATQSLGVLQVQASDADVIVSSSYKWLLGPHGLGIVHINSDKNMDLSHSGVGWRSVTDVFAEDRMEHIHLHDDARKFELGYPSFPSIYLLHESLQALSHVDQAALEKHARDMSGRLYENLSGEGFNLLTPRDPLKRGTNISVEHREGETIANRMLDEGVHVWGGDGRVRFSVHGFNNENDIEQATSAFLRAAKAGA